MDNQNTEAQDLIVQAREALRRGDKETARKLGEQAALQAPDMEAAWLILTASEPNPEDALAYAQQALEINPSSERALKAVEWAIAQLKKTQAAPGQVAPEAAAAPVPAPTKSGQAKPPARKSNPLPFIFAAVVFALCICAVIIYAAYTGMAHPAFASILNSASAPTQENLWAPMDLAKPAGILVESDGVAQQVTSTPSAQPTQQPATSVPTETAVSVPTATPTTAPTEAPTEEAATEEATDAPAVTETPGVMSMEIVVDTPTSQYVAPTSSAPLPEAASSGNGVRWIDVDLTNQMVYAYEDESVVNSFIVSTGTWLTPTVTGQYKIYVKYRSAPMSGPGYYLPNVPYIMYFYKGYGLHGTYWHNNFGTPMSHGCVNLRTDEAAWLYNWASVGTLVNVHY